MQNYIVNEPQARPSYLSDPSQLRLCPRGTSKRPHRTTTRSQGDRLFEWANHYRRVARFAIALLWWCVGSSSGRGESVLPEQAVVVMGRSASFSDLALELESQPLVHDGTGVIPPFMPGPIESPVSGDVSAAFDPLRSSIVKKSAIPVITAPKVKSSFLGLEDNDRAIPPDTQGTVGPNHLMIALNSQVRIQSRSGDVISTVSLKSFWTNLVDNIGNTFDPKIVYDLSANRWVAVTLSDSVSTNSSVLVAVSETGDPTGKWFGFKIRGDGEGVHWADYPIVGFNKKWIVITANLYSVTENRLGLSRIYVLNKNSVYANGSVALAAKTFDDKGGFAIAPAIDYDGTMQTMTLVNVQNGNSNGKGFLRLSTMTGEVGAEVYNPGTTFPAVTSPWATSPAAQDFAPQLGSPTRINTGDNRLQNGVVFRNGSLWLCHTVFLPVTNVVRSAIQWWELSPAGVVRQFGRIDDPTSAKFYAYPSMAVNKNSDVLIGYSSFSATQYASASYSFRAATDTTNTLRADTILKGGEAPYFKTHGGTRNRWGDYSSTVVDPVNEIDMWTIQQFTASGTNTWGTWWGRIALEAPGIPPSVTAFTPSTGGIGTLVTITGTKFTEVTSVKFNGVSATQFSVQSGTRLTAFVPLAATTGPITVASTDETGTSSASFTVVPTPAIASFAPDRGGIGTAVVITGVNFNGATNVTFNDTIVPRFTIESSTRISTIVPVGATSGKISVTTAQGTGTSSNAFSLSVLPAITSFGPLKAGPGGKITILGANFIGTTNVQFNDVRATEVVIDSPTQITATVPDTATTGLVRVSTLIGSVTSTAVLTIVPVPIISSLNPLGAPAGASVTITGANFEEATEVRFNGVRGTAFSVDSPRQITVRVPPGSTTGSITVTTPGGTATSFDDFRITLPPVNDQFAAAQVLAGVSGSVSGSSVGATKEAGEPDHAGDTGGRTVWYRWTAPTAGAWNFHTSGSKIDTTLAVYTGSSLTNLAVVAQNDDATSGTATSSVSFSAAAGATYHIVIAGFRDASGDIVLTWTSTSALPVVRSFSPPTGPIGSSVVIDGANFGGTTNVKFSGVSAGGFTIESPIRIVAQVPTGATTGPIQVITQAGTGSSTNAFIVTPPLANDNFANGQTIAGPSGSVSIDNTGASAEPGEPDHAKASARKSVWYRWTAPDDGIWTFATLGSSIDTVLAVYAGGALTNLVVVGSNDDADGSGGSSVSIKAEKGKTYHIAIDGFAGVFGNIILDWKFTGNVPRLDTFTPVRAETGTAVTIVGANFVGNLTVNFNGLLTTVATVDSSTQVTAKIPAGATTGPITIVTTNGAAVSANYFVVSNSDAPANDLFVNAQTITGSAAIVAGSNLRASKEPGENDHAGEKGGRSVWYRWTAPGAGQWTIGTRGSTFDTLLAVYQGNALTNLTLVASNDDADIDVTSKVRFRAEAGQDYRIAVDGYGGESGHITLKLIPPPEPIVIYATGFEAAEGYKSDQSVSGQNGWNKTGPGGNLVLSNAFGLGQQARIGFSTSGGAVRSSVWRSVTNAQSLVQFSVSMAIVGSTNKEDDLFDWAVFNSGGQFLFGLDFDTFGSVVGYELNDGEGVLLTDVAFKTNQVYELAVTMDFVNNLWSATLGSLTLVEGEPITTTETALSLGYIDAVWFTDETPGNNYMVFDNYRIVAEPSLPPSILVQPQAQSVPLGTDATLAVVAQGAEPLSYQWLFNGAVVTGATNAILVLNNALPNNSGNYSVEAKNSLGSAASASAPLQVTMPVSFKLMSGPRMSDDRFQVILSGTSGSRFSIEASTNLMQWLEIAAGTNATGTFIYLDNEAAKLPSRFYRARQIP